MTVRLPSQERPRDSATGNVLELTTPLEKITGRQISSPPRDGTDHFSNDG